MKRLSLLCLAFAVLSAFFFLILVFFRTPSPFYSLMSYQDTIDLLTPMVLIPFYWLLFRKSTSGKSILGWEIVFMVLSAVWVMGHGIHLAANSINNLAENLAQNQGLDITGTEIYDLTYFYDEHLSHYLWYIGVLGMIAFLSYREWRRPAGLGTVWWQTVLAGLIYGITLFAIILEGQTVPLGFPFAIVFSLVVLIWGRKKLAARPLLAFFFLSCLLALVLFVGWGLYWGGFPQFSDVGLI